MLAGGSTGPAVVPGNPKESLLVDAINYGETYQMPPKSKLPDGGDRHSDRMGQERRSLGRRDATATASPARPSEPRNPDRLSKDEFTGAGSILELSADPARDAPRRERRPPWLGAQPDRSVHPGDARRARARAGARGRQADLDPPPQLRPDRAAPYARTRSPRFWPIRAPDAYERLVDRLLASPRYGERWARHWLDLVRYAETAGHEFDYDIVNAFRYRDYVIRAFNADLPYDQFVTEQIAGDLLESPRRHPAEGFNESILGTGFYFLGEGTHSPVDVREEQMRRIDNQIDVISKTFLGLTVACARCHDHKFDPITNKDYYALAGFLRSSRHQQALSIVPERIAADGERLQSSQEDDRRPCATRGHATRAGPGRVTAGDDSARPAVAEAAKRDEVVFEDFNRDSFDGWFVTGDAFGDRPSRPGDLRLDLAGGASRLVPVKPGQAHSGLISDRLRGVLRSRSFTIETRYIHWLVAGRGGRINVVVDGFEKIRDPIYGGLDAENRHRRPAALGHAGPRHVAGPFGLSRDRRRRDRRLRRGNVADSTTAAARSRSTRSGCRISRRPARPDGASSRTRPRARPRCGRSPI